MGVIPTVLRRGFVREDLVVGYVVEVQIVACWPTNDWRVYTKIADQSSHRDVHYVVAEAPAIRPTTGNNAIPKARLNLADQGVISKDAQPGEAGIIRIRTLLSSISRQPAGICG